jgi:serine/threonine protein kinase
MQSEKQCNILKCSNFKKIKVTEPLINIYNCRCCNKSFCSDKCLVEHLIIIETEKRTKDCLISIHNHSIRSIFMKPGIILKEKERSAYFDFANFEKVKVGNKYKILGSGAFGEVYLARNSIDSKFYAIKHINKSKLDSVSIKPELIYREINVHTKLLHDHIARLYDYHEDNKSFYLIVEYIENGTLFKIIQKTEGLSEDESFKYFIQVASALNFLHQNNMIHRDLKPENILINKDGNVKLCDFGWTVETNKTRETFCGTYEYMAPEIIVEKPYNKAIDVWSLGILLYELLHSYSPFRAKSSNHGPNENSSYKEVMKNVVNHKFKIEKKISDECRDLLVNLLNPKMENRMTISEVFQHPWVKKYEKNLKEAHVEKDIKKFNTMQEENKYQLNLNKSADSHQGNITVIDSLQIIQKDNTLFDNVLDQLQAKSKNKRKSSLKVEKNKSKENKNKIVLRVEKPQKEELSKEKEKNENNLCSQQTKSNCFNNTMGQMTIPESPIKKYQQSIYNDSCFSMYKEMKEIDREIDKKLIESDKQFENFKKRNAKIKENLMHNSKNESTYNLGNNYDYDCESPLNNNQKKYDSSSKIFENLKTQPQSMLYNSNIEISQRPDNKVSENGEKILIHPEKKIHSNNYNDLIYSNMGKNLRSDKKSSQSKKNLKMVNKEVALIEKKKLNYSDCLNFDESLYTNLNPMNMDISKSGRYGLSNKSEMSIQTDTPQPSNSIWSKFFGFLGAFKCGS